MTFSDLGLAPALAAPLARLGYTDPTPVQAASIPLVLAGSDLLARAQTGTGKTAAFGLPMIERLLVRSTRPRTRRPIGLVLVPTRELAVQVHASLVTYGAPVQLQVTHIFGGVSIEPQKRALRQGTHIVVATPGRLLDHLQQRTVDLSAVEILTLDEADRMLDMGFLPALRRVIAAVPTARQTLLFSATLPPEVVRLSADFTRVPKRVDISQADALPSAVTHRVHPVALDRKRDVLVHVLTGQDAGQALVFCKTKRGSNRVGDHLERAGLKVAVIHGNKSQGARTKALADFKAGRATVLVATDIAARGLDIPQLPLVVNFDLPLVAEDYIHRIGRTARAGRTGNAVSLVSAEDRPLLRQIQRLLPAPIEQVALSGFDAPRGALSGNITEIPVRSRRPLAEIAPHAEQTSPRAREAGETAAEGRAAAGSQEPQGRSAAERDRRRPGHRRHRPGTAAVPLGRRGRGRGRFEGRGGVGRA